MSPHARAACARSRRLPAWTSRRGARATRSCCAGAAFRIAPSRWAAGMLRALFSGLRDRGRCPRHAGRCAFARSQSTAGLRSARRRRADGCGAGRDRAGQGRAPPGASGCPCPRARRLGALRADRIHGRRARTVAIRRRAIHRAWPLRPRRPARSAGALSGRPRTLSVGRPGNVQLYVVRSLGVGSAGSRAADRRAGRTRARQRRGLGDDRCRMARRGEDAGALARSVGHSERRGGARRRGVRHGAGHSRINRCER